MPGAGHLEKEIHMQEFSYTITDPNGIHARPAGLFAQKMQEYKSSVTVNRGEQSVDAKKLIALMKLRLKCGQTFTVQAKGEDETAAIEAARDFLTANL
jgi:phosphotransferase system HPr (HPr) family protein